MQHLAKIQPIYLTSFSSGHPASWKRFFEEGGRFQGKLRKTNLSHSDLVQVLKKIGIRVLSLTHYS